MKKNILISGMVLLTTFLAVGCSNNTAKNTNDAPKSSQTSHSKKHHVKKHADDQQSTQTDDSSQSSQQSSNDADNKADTQNNDKNNAQNDSKQISNDTVFNVAVKDTVRRDQYPAGTNEKDFTLYIWGNGRYALAEKSTGTIIAHYKVANGKIYYEDLSGKDIPIY